VAVSPTGPTGRPGNGWVVRHSVGVSPFGAGLLRVSISICRVLPSPMSSHRNPPLKMMNLGGRGGEVEQRRAVKPMTEASQSVAVRMRVSGESVSGVQSLTRCRRPARARSGS
jgi:hypothetical protein